MNLMKNGLVIWIKYVGKFLMQVFSELLYGQHVDKKTLHFDSRTIPPPQEGSNTERRVFAAAEFPAEYGMANKKLSNSERIRFVLPYTTPEVHSSIYWFKYKRDQYATEMLAKLLWEEIIDAIGNTLDDRMNIDVWIISSAPSTSFLTGSKKWDHCAVLLNLLKSAPSTPLSDNDGKNFIFQELFTVSEELLAKDGLKNNKKLNRKSRIQISGSKFTLKGRDSIIDTMNDRPTITPDTGLIIFDDVTTTGSTLLSLEKLANQSGQFKKVLLIALAH